MTGSNVSTTKRKPLMMCRIFLSTINKHNPRKHRTSIIEHWRPYFKRAMKGQNVEDVLDIQQRLTSTFRAISSEAFADRFQQLYNH